MPNTALSLLKTDLGYTGTLPDDLTAYLEWLLATAQAELAERKISLRSPGPDELQVMYAAWLYRKRVNGEPMGPMVAQAIKNRKVSRDAAPEVQS